MSVVTEARNRGSLTTSGSGTAAFTTRITEALTRSSDRYFVGVTRPFLQASVNSALESLPSRLASAELKVLTADLAWASETLPVSFPSSLLQAALQAEISLWVMVCDHTGPANMSIATVVPTSVLMECSFDAAWGYDNVSSCAKFLVLGGQDHLQDWLANRIEAMALILLDTCEKCRSDGRASAVAY